MTTAERIKLAFFSMEPTQQYAILSELVNEMGDSELLAWMEFMLHDGQGKNVDRLYEVSALASPEAKRERGE